MKMVVFECEGQWQWYVQYPNASIGACSYQQYSNKSKAVRGARRFAVHLKGKVPIEVLD